MANQGPSIELEGGGGTNYGINDALTTSNYKVKNTTEFWGGNASSPPEVDLFDICELRKESSTREMNVDIAHTKTNLGSFYVNSYSNSLNYRLLDVVTPWQRGINIGYNSEIALIKGTTPREFAFNQSLTNSHASTLTGNKASYLLSERVGTYFIKRGDNQFTVDSEVTISGSYATLADAQNTKYYPLNTLGLPTNVTKAPYMMLLLVGGAGGGGSSGTDIFKYTFGGFNAHDVHGGAGGGGGGVGVFVLDFSSCDGFVIKVGSGGSGGSAGSKATGGSSGGSGSQNAGSAGGSTTVYAATNNGGRTYSITKIITCGGGAGGDTSTTSSKGSQASGGTGGSVTHHDTSNSYSYLVGSTSGGSGGKGGASTDSEDRASEETLRTKCTWSPGSGSGTGEQKYYMTGNSSIVSTLYSTSAQSDANSANSNGYFGAGGNGGSSLGKGAKAVVWGNANDGTLGSGGSGGDFGTDGGYAGGKGGDGFFALYY